MAGTVQAIFAGDALLPTGWARDVRVVLQGERIDSVDTGVLALPDDTRVQTLIPGIANLHSHAFQRGMAGLAERRGVNADSFWTWREIMYRFALGLTPDDMQAVAEMAYVEMLEAGFTRVGEFHYLHHDRDGRAYSNPAELSERIIEAAKSTGINLTHLPVFYAHSDFGGRPPNDGQRRFIHDLDQYHRLVTRVTAELRRPLDRIGIAPHSLRAVTPDELSALIAAHPDIPLHLHIAEQMREVEDCIAHCAQRPVEWLLDHLPVDRRWCLIHATHLTEGERQGIAQSGAVVGLCPITEANLGDGVFPAHDVQQDGGRFGIGSDSNVEISAAGELRLLEYGQRLVRRQRNVLAGGPGSTGAALVNACTLAGAQALGAPQASLVAGAPADLVALADPLALTGDGERTLDRWIFGRDIRIGDVWAAGVHLVEDGRHRSRDAVVARFTTALKRLLA